MNTPHTDQAAINRDDDQAHEILDQLDDKIEIAYELGDAMLVDHLERVKRNFVRQNREELQN